MVYRYIVCIVFFYICYTEVQVYAQEQEKSSPETIEELEAAIIKVLEQTKTPAVGLVLIKNDSSTWIKGLGKADLEQDIQADENTMFRIGSTSKMYVSLAVLKLCEEGRLDLKDKVRTLVPEIEFVNPWSETDPILVEHLLEHTTGWDDMHLADYALDAKGFSLKEGLDYHPHSRTSRWVPGTRMSYCNSGPPVAAYIIEKITGQAFEDHIQEHFFTPMRMENMTYFETDKYKELGAKLYMDGIPQNYWNISVRPSGSINASAKDMARMLRFFIKRGLADSTRLLSEASLNRMETAKSTSGARAGLEYGYGLSNYSTSYKGFVFRTHNGGVNGGLTDLSYLPEYGLGYAVMINSSNGNTLYQITQMLREFLTKDLDQKEHAITTNKPNSIEPIAGYYLAINPRIQLFWFIQRIIGFKRIWNKEGRTIVKSVFGGWPQKYVSMEKGKYCSPETGKVAMVETVDPLDGKVLHNGQEVLKRISPIVFYGQLFLLVAWVIGVFSSIIFAIYGLYGYFIKKTHDKASLSLVVWPFIASLMILLSYLLEFIASSNPIAILGSANPLSISIMILSICFALASLWSLVVSIRKHTAAIRKSLRWHSLIVSALHVTATGYLLWHGMIGLQSWSY